MGIFSGLTRLPLAFPPFSGYNKQAGFHTGKHAGALPAEGIQTYRKDETHMTVTKDTLIGDILDIAPQTAPYFLLKELRPGFLDGVTGVYHTPQGYYVEETAAEDFDRNFPPKEKLKLPGQLF